MDIYRIELKSIPKIEFAYSTSTDKYSNNVKATGVFEINLINGGKIKYYAYGREYIINEKTLSIWVPDLYCEAKAVDNCTINLAGVLFRSDDMAVKRYIINSRDEWNDVKAEFENSIAMPFNLELGDKFSEYLNIMMNIIHNSAKSSVEANLKCIGMLFMLLSQIDKETRELLDGFDRFSSTAIYMKKIRSYIDRNYYKKLTISDIAKELKISTSYTGKIFKKNTNLSFSAYVNMVRVQKAREIFIEEENVSHEIVANRVGFCDARYMNMMFKRFLGISVSKCIQADREVSLIVVKPWERQ